MRVTITARLPQNGHTGCLQLLSVLIGWAAIFIVESLFWLVGTLL